MAWRVKHYTVPCFLAVRVVQHATLNAERGVNILCIYFNKIIEFNYMYDVYKW